MLDLASAFVTVSDGSRCIEPGVLESGPECRDLRVKEIEGSAKQLLEVHPHFRGRSQWVKCRFLDDCLYLEGTLPTYYLKQSAQEALRELPGIERIVNFIQVTSPSGFVVPPDDTKSVRKPR